MQLGSIAQNAIAQFNSISDVANKKMGLQEGHMAGKAVVAGSVAALTFAGVMGARSLDTSKLVSAMQAGATAISNQAGSAYTSAANTASGLSSKVTGFGSSVASTVSSGTSKAVSTVSSGASSAMSGISSGASKVASAVSSGVSYAAGSAWNATARATDFAGSFFKKI